ncbi:2',3'-cyclic-nucleotide 2'-phosphodiesterase / 3'-nucleotidase [Shimia gijangensis]|uniref:2',3'-cyclic-nucleotide 2'-phosphodiesterase / 3'-nucleotidase n=1 Tax=Shimia gijangensis TaxID=1470563 RepID=A0A1M6KI23_9RHOB|nr:bifunctional 2',3'-cyclic-nucleotide 2'-phosphodiesterase/3'-nucleotidase [Shimia gijangensis]SHJ58551.1 2',3'-cyclic-nucleotide 2'-phosphodiesterase / 3'-nucleotidase [Shimia gijangensis]
MPEPDSSKINSNDIRLTLLATTDVHAHLLAYDYYSDHPAKEKSALSRLATLIASERSKNQNVILVDNGDFLQGTPLADVFTDQTPPETVSHPVVEAMNALDYDAAALGNHEFNVPLDRLSAILREMQFPLLCANLTPVDPDEQFLKNLWQSHVILEPQIQDQSGQLQTVRIGLFGVLPPQVLNWDYSRVSGKISAQDSVDAAQVAVQDLRDQGADVVIGLAHTGVSNDTRQGNMENAGLYIAGIEGIDALILGHSHLRFPETDQPDHPEIRERAGTIAGVPTVMPGSAAAYLGKIDLVLEKSGASWNVRSHAAELIPGTGAKLLAEDPNIVARLTPAHEWVLSRVREPLGEVPFPIHSYFSLLPGCTSVRLVAHAQAKYLRSQLKGTSLANLPLLSAAAPQKCGGRSGSGHFTHIPAGPIALRNISDIQFFPNDVSALQLTGCEIVDWLEMSASIYNQVLPDCSEQPLRNDDFPPYNSDTIFGLTYEIDLSLPPRFDPNGHEINPETRRVRNIRHHGTAIDSKQSFVLAVNNYRSGGGGGFPHVTPDRIVFQSDTKIRDLLAETVARPLSLDALPPSPWSFLPIAGASVVFDTGPGVKPFLNQLSIPGLEEIGPTHDGFLRMRLSMNL